MGEDKPKIRHVFADAERGSMKPPREKLSVRPHRLSIFAGSNVTHVPELPPLKDSEPPVPDLLFGSVG